MGATDTVVSKYYYLYTWAPLIKYKSWDCILLKYLDIVFYIRGKFLLSNNILSRILYYNK